MAVIELREQSDGRWLIVRVAADGDTQDAWISPQSIVGCARTIQLMRAMARGIREYGNTVVLVPKKKAT